MDEVVKSAPLFEFLWNQPGVDRTLNRGLVTLIAFEDQGQQAKRCWQSRLSDQLALRRVCPACASRLVQRLAQFLAARSHSHHPED